MTQERLQQAKIAEAHIKEIKEMLYTIKRIKLLDKTKMDNNHRPFFRFANLTKKKEGKEVKEASLILFDGINMNGTNIPADDGLLEVVKKYYENKLSEAEANFDAI